MASLLVRRAKVWSSRSVVRREIWLMEFAFERTRGAAATSAEQKRTVLSRRMMFVWYWGKEGVSQSDRCNEF
jgi:hypothetical protein